MAPVAITEVKIGPPPKNVGDWPRTLAYLTLKTRDARSLRSEWDQWLFTGAFAHLSAKRHLPVVFGYHDSEQLSGRPSPPAATAADAATLESRVRQAVSDTAGTSGVQIVSLRITQPDGLAYVLVLQVSDAGAYLKHQFSDLLHAVYDFRATIDGSYLEIRDASGVVLIRAGSTRAGAGGYSVRRELEDCSPIITTRAFGQDPPPPCPAA
jgi:hypothetical protein